MSWSVVALAVGVAGGSCHRGAGRRGSCRAWWPPWPSPRASSAPARRTPPSMPSPPPSPSCSWPCPWLCSSTRSGFFVVARRHVERRRPPRARPWVLGRRRRRAVQPRRRRGAADAALRAHRPPLRPRRPRPRLPCPRCWRRWPRRCCRCRTSPTSSSPSASTSRAATSWSMRPRPPIAATSSAGSPTAASPTSGPDPRGRHRARRSAGVAHRSARRGLAAARLHRRRAPRPAGVGGRARRPRAAGRDPPQPAVAPGADRRRAAGPVARHPRRRSGPHLGVEHVLGVAGVPGQLLAFGAAVVAANLVNNLPALLVALPALAAHRDKIWAVLLGVNIGPTLWVTGALSTLLWQATMRSARRARERPAVRRHRGTRRAPGARCRRRRHRAAVVGVVTRQRLPSPPSTKERMAASG